jgi:hypothetical protein
MMPFILSVLAILPTSNTNVCLPHRKGTNLRRYGSTTPILGLLVTPPHLLITLEWSQIVPVVAPRLSFFPRIRLTYGGIGRVADGTRTRDLL